MGYNGYLIKVGSYIIPGNKYIKANSYSAYLNLQDLDSYRDADGVLHRNALAHQPIKVEFETPAMLSNADFADLMSNIRSQFSNTAERKASVTVYVPETNSYVTQDMYMPDIKPTIFTTHDGVIRYNAIRLAFIGY